MPPLFEFRLKPLDQIVPWGMPNDPNLHWFGLSDGSYWINAGEAKLFEYSDTVRARGIPRFCEYQVVRLHEDLIAIAPYVLEEVPENLRRFIGTTANSPRDNFWHAWMDLPESRVESNEHADLIDYGSTWLGQRSLDSLYLSPATDICMWSDAENVYIQWDNRERLIDGQPAWSATVGTHVLSRELFVEELLSFHERFMAAMEDRVQRVMAGELQKSIRIDLDSLVREQRTRTASLNRDLLTLGAGTDWTRVSEAVARLEELRSETSQSKPDFVEVSREAHQLAESHGPRAHVYALRLSEKAKAIGDVEAAGFWRAVYESLRPRHTSTQIDEVLSLLREAIPTLPPAHRAALERALIPPRELAIEDSPGEFVVAVAEVGSTLLYWSDVEEGWELQTPSKDGSIPCRGCNQSELGEVLHQALGPADAI